MLLFDLALGLMVFVGSFTLAVVLYQYLNKKD